jgi:GNAT superfamily N-acetyltransferase
VTAETLAAWNRMGQVHPSRIRRVATVGEELAAFCGAVSVDGGCWFRVVVDPRFRGRGIGSALLREAKQFAVESGAQSLTAHTRDAATVAFAEERGFSVSAEMIQWELDLETFTRLPPNGTLSLEELGDFDRFHAALPAMEFGDVVGAEEFRARHLEDPRWAAMQTLVLDGDAIVGVACVQPIPGTTTAFHAGTGVLPTHRRRGIGTAVKLRAIHEARRLGFTRLETGNDAKNVAALALNRSLGYREVALLRTLTAPVERRSGD